MYFVLSCHYDKPSKRLHTIAIINLLCILSRIVQHIAGNAEEMHTFLVNLQKIITSVISHETGQYQNNHL